MAKSNGTRSGEPTGRAGAGVKTSTKITGRAASRIQSAADRDPGSPLARSGFARRAQSAAARDTGGSGSR